MLVTTCVVVWIEILGWPLEGMSAYVTTCVVVWIEIEQLQADRDNTESPPAWWCGLKCIQVIMLLRILQSPPAWWCGLKY